MQSTPETPETPEALSFPFRKGIRLPTRACAFTITPYYSTNRTANTAEIYAHSSCSCNSPHHPIRCARFSYLLFLPRIFSSEAIAEVHRLRRVQAIDVAQQVLRDDEGVLVAEEQEAGVVGLGDRR